MRTLCLGCLLLLGGCWPDPLLRMKEQAKVDAYEEEPLLPSRAPPPGTVPRERRLLSPEAMTGRVGGMPGADYVKKSPLPLDREMLEQGRRRFERICATCHGLTGDGTSMVAQNMSLRPPPSLHEFRDRPDGYLFEVITQGFGLMPALAEEIPLEERWGTVAYLRALQLSQAARLEQAPEEARRKLLEEPR